MLVLYPYKNALWALRLCNRGRLLSVRPAPTMFDHLYASLHRAFGHTRPASLPGLNVGLPPLDQARMLAVSRTKPLHDAVAQMADDLYGGYAPATPFSINKRFIDRLNYFISVFTFFMDNILLHKTLPCFRYDNMLYFFLTKSDCYSKEIHYGYSENQKRYSKQQHCSRHRVRLYKN